MPRTLRTPSVWEARARDAAQRAGQGKRDEWYIEKVTNHISLNIRQRVVAVTEYLREKVVRNISVPVVKQIVVTPTGTRTRVTERSKPGEFPRADTTLLRKTIFSDIKEPAPGICDGFVGTPLEYGVVLELQKDRSFLVRTLEEERPKIVQMLTGRLPDT